MLEFVCIFPARKFACFLTILNTIGWPTCFGRGGKVQRLLTSNVSNCSGLVGMGFLKGDELEVGDTIFKVK